MGAGAAMEGVTRSVSAESGNMRRRDKTTEGLDKYIVCK